ncbi:3-oxoadipate enol-lactonase [Neomegalonema perideroedes]|uniref:3-oxoadipate enol-lactonase n=1 Tax=Neomegalonema perideroedes TaxID=217219 RepID=UPI0003786E3C|nr:3-oxoadipate enol-lactonase [Neomegalonema perideroedes]
MKSLKRPWGVLHYRVDGPESAPAVVFANSLGTDLRLWEAALRLLPEIRAIRFDKRGHGLSDLGGLGGAPVSIAGFAEDAAALIEAEAQGPVVFVGLSIGGMIGQSLAAARPDLVRALVLSNTAPRMGTPESWRARVAAVRAGGVGSLAEAVMERWFGPAFRAGPDLPLWRNMLARTDPEGYAAACEAIAAADLTTGTAKLRLPTLVIGGEEDGASPPDLVRGLADLTPGAAFHLIPKAGHLPCVETPEAFAAILAPFLKEHAR